MSFKNVVLGIGIFVVYALVLWQGIQAFYPSPEWGDYCKNEVYPKIPVDGVNCTFPSDLRNKENACYEAGGYVRYEYDDNGCTSDVICDECQIKYDDASDSYSRNIFIISLIIGIITFVVGFLILKVEPVGSALLASGIYAVFYGTVWNWRNFGAGIRFGLLLLVLVVLIWIALRLNVHKKKGFFAKIFGK